MKLKELIFENSNSQRIYDQYLKRIKRTIKPLPGKDQKEVLLEFNSHIYEGLQNRNGQNEVANLLDILDRLGEPEVVLKMLIADKKMDQAVKTFNPIYLVKALALNLSNGISYLLFLILYLSLAGFLFLIYAEVSNPQEVGLILEKGSFLTLGRMNPEYLSRSDVEEVLGNWFIPSMLVSMLVLYFLLTLLLRLKRTINNK